MRNSHTFPPATKIQPICNIVRWEMLETPNVAHYVRFPNKGNNYHEF